MSEFPKSYTPEECEHRWYDLWSGKGYFRPEAKDDGAPYTIVIPPPNVTGSLHMGHALNATVQDIIIRARRMRGQRALWVPGTDHAGIATQNVVERQIAAEGLDRHKMGREKFIERVWKWKAESGGNISKQLRVLGASCDWSRERFTLDDGLSSAVREVFVRLYEEGLIYRDKRLINWCPRCHTALSDLEVEHEDLEGVLTYIKYPAADGKDSLTVATTRPETMLGDTAVAVNPEDERYKHLIGKMLALPLTGRAIPVVGDSAVDAAFGTGAVKVTPAHDFNDEAIAKRQSPPLPSITVIGEDGRMTKDAGDKFAGLDRYECRRKVVDDLRALGLLGSEEKHNHAVGHCYRCKTIVEPFGTPQWYVRIQPLADEAMEAVRDGRIRIVPEGWQNSYFAWMENIRDWCITRQIWWGHRVPVWYCDECGEIIVSRTDPDKCAKCGSASLTRDPDVLDTWFSSALWPFSTLGWPEQTPDLKAHYPTAVLVTAFDILFFWVARMIMMGLKFMGDVPFKDVYIHALVRDSEGQKMSKSKGNVIDPLTMTSKYGADAFRFSLAAFAAQGRDIRFSEERVEGYRHFINKLWNATRFMLMNIPPEYGTPHIEDVKARALAQLTKSDTPLSSRWIISRLSHASREVNVAIDEYRFNDAASAVYSFIWLELCDWYLEMSKSEMDDRVRDTLLYCLDTVLRLLHPFMPFVTEEIRSRLPLVYHEDSIMISAFPGTDLPADAEAERGAAVVMDAILGIRNIRGELNLPPAEILEVHIKALDAEAEAVLKAGLHYVEKLSRCKVAALGQDVARPPKTYIAVKPRLEASVVLAGFDVTAEIARLEKDLKKTGESMAQVARKLTNEDFIKRAPAEIVAKEKAKQAEFEEKINKLTESIAKLRSVSG